MQDFCPLCSKNGIKKEMKLLQINLQEAVFMCEEEKCLWPFGYADFIFYPRPVGKIWSCYWNDNKSITSKSKENVAFVKEKLYNVNVSDECTVNFDKDSDYSKNNIININFNALKTKNCKSNSIFEEPHVSQNIHDQGHLNAVSSNEEVNTTSNTNKCSSQAINEDMTSISKKTENTNLFSRYTEDKMNLSMQNCQNLNNINGIPKITNIEKANISVSNSTTGHQIFVEQNLEALVHNKHINNIEYEFTSVPSDKQFPTFRTECNQLTTRNLFENEQGNGEATVVKGNGNNTMMEMKGLPPITLPYATPACSSTIHKTMASNTNQTGTENIPQRETNNSMKLNNLVKQNVARGKRYEKFSFSAIKKKLESHSILATNSSSLNSTSMKLNVDIQDNEINVKDGVKRANSNGNSNNNQITHRYNSDIEQITAVKHQTTQCLPNQINNSVTINNSSKEEHMSSDTSTVNAAVNFDTVFNDLLTNDYVSTDINDEWISSLLT